MLQWGVIGVGRIARKFLGAVRESSMERVVALASRDLQRAEAAAHEFGVPRAYDSYDALLADPAVTAVYIALPNALHAEWTMRAARAGKHILCEKPLGMNVAEAETMFAAAREYGVWLMEAFMYRFHPQTLRLQQLIAAGAIGRPRLLRVSFCFLLDRPHDPRWNADLGGGSLYDVGCYCVNVARMLLGAAPARVSATARWAASGVDELLAATLEYPDGAVAQIACSFGASFHQSLQVAGDDGLIEVDRAFTMPPDQPATIRLWRGAHFAPLETIEIAAVNHYRLEAEGLAALVAAGPGAHGLPEMPLRETLDNLATIEALYRSARAGAPVDL